MWIISSLSSALLNLFKLPLAPFVHLFKFAYQLSLLPLESLAKFESLYIFFSIAALVGILSGFTLYLTSSLLSSLIDLQPTPAAPKANPEKIKATEDIDEWRQGGGSKLRPRPPPSKEVIRNAYHNYWEKSYSASERRGSLGKVNLYAQPILEDDSEDDS